MLHKYLDGILLPEYQAQGFTIRESDDHFVHILWHGIIMATFTQYTTAEQLNDACKQILLAE